MKLHGVFLSMIAGSLVSACGSVVSLTDLPCPCASGFECCDKVCVAEGSCDSGKLISFGTGDSGVLEEDGDVATGFTSSASGRQDAGDVVINFTSSSSASERHDADVGFGNSGGLVDAGTDTAAADSAYCYYSSDAGGYDCSYETDMPSSMSFSCGCTGSQGNSATAAQTELSCMQGGGSIVTTCPSESLVGCCTSSYGSWGGLPPYTKGTTVACSYGADMQYRLQCLANGGSWSVTAPQ